MWVSFCLPFKFILVNNGISGFVFAENTWNQIKLSICQVIVDSVKDTDHP